MRATREQIRRAYIDACYQEIEALKPGNVHRFADGHRMNAGQFFDSAQASADSVADTRVAPGARILAAISATHDKVGVNTNLGIVLLCVPLAKAAEKEKGSLRARVNSVLGALDIADARAAFAAIRIARPAGLGSVEKNDVSSEPEVSLLEAMRQAQDRDMIARQYANGFNDILEGGLGAHRAALERGEQHMWPVVFTYLHFLSSFPDSHILRKHGTDVTRQAQERARQILDQVEGLKNGRARESILLAFDSELKEAGINPGTSADLTVATVFAVQLNLVLHIGEVNA